MKVFILSCEEKEKGGGIYAYALTKNGSLERTGYFPCDKPMYAVKSENSLCVLLRSPFKSDKNSGYFFVDADFKSATAVKSTQGVVACHLCVENENAYIVNYLSGNIVRNGEKIVKREGKSVNPIRQSEPHTHFIDETPDGYLAVCDLGTDTLAFYDKELRLVSESKVPLGYGVRHLVFSKASNYIYAVNELVPSVSVFAYADGKAELIDTVEINCSNLKANGAAIRLSVDGKALFVSIREENAILVYEVEGAKLTLVSKSDCGGDSPRDINLFGEYLIATNERSNNAVVFKINSDFSLTKTDEINLPAPLCCL